VLFVNGKLKLIVGRSKSITKANTYQIGGNMNLKEIAIHELEQSAKQTLARIVQLRQSIEVGEIEDIEAELFADARVLEAKAGSLAVELELEAEAELALV
jgi:hypothetical protein